MSSYSLLFKQNKQKDPKKKAQRCAFGDKTLSETSLKSISDEYGIEDTLRKLSCIPGDINLEIIKAKVFATCWLNKDKNSTQACNDVTLRYVADENFQNEECWWAKVKSFFSFTYEEKTFDYAVITWWLHKDGDEIGPEGDCDLDFGVPLLREGYTFDLVQLDSLKSLEQMIPILRPEMFKKKENDPNFDLYVPSTSASFLPPFPFV